MAQDPKKADAPLIPLKEVWGAEYVRNAGFSFSSSDELVSSLLKFSAGKLELGGQAAEAHAKDLSTAGARVRDWLKRAAT